MILNKINPPTIEIIIIIILTLVYYYSKYIVTITGLIYLFIIPNKMFEP